MPVVPQPIVEAHPLDLASSDFVSSVLAAGGITPNASQSAIMASLVTAASREIIRFCGNRPFAAQAFSEILTPEGTRQDRGEPVSAKLSRFPVLSITRCATGRTAALTLTNTTADEATAVFVSSGDADFDNFVYSGVTLSRTVAGVVTTNTITWTTSSPYTTIASVATSINALSGSGWTATTPGGTPNVSRLPAAYLVGIREPKGGSPGATLEVFGTNYTGYAIERSTGILRCSGLFWGNGFGGWDGNGCWGESSSGYYGWPDVQVVYRAGFEVVPEQLQLVTAEVVQLMLNRLLLDSSLKSETTGKYSWVARDAIGNLSDGAMATLNLYRDWTV